MTVKLAKTAGFCFGVNNAVNLALRTVEDPENAGRRVVTLGPIIHNRIVVDRLAEKGISVIESPEEAMPGDVVIIRAHGVAPSVIEALKSRGAEVIDATCPFVKKIHKTVAEEYAAGRRIIIVGDKDHPEVIGTNGCCDNTAIIIADETDCAKIKPSDMPAACVVQTTFNTKIFAKIEKILKETLDEIFIYDTICYATVQRQEEAAKLAEESDLMVVIGSRSSSNTLKLCDICRAICPRVQLVEDPRDLDLSGSNFFHIGVTAGASTPGWLIEEVLVIMDEVKSIENEIVTDEAVESAETVEVAPEAAENEVESFEDLLNESLTTVKSGEVVEKPIIKIDATRVYLDLGFKYEGYVDINEFDETPEIGAMVKAYVVHVSDRDCEVKLSKSKVDKNVDLIALEEAYKNETPVTVKVIRATERGVIASYGTAQLYISAAQLDLFYVKKLEDKVGQEIEVKITRFETDEKGRLRISGSAKTLLAEKKKAADDEFWGSLEVGKIYTGLVKGITKTGTGAFIQLAPGYDGFLPVREASWLRIKEIGEIFKKGDYVRVKVLDFNREKERIDLTAKMPEDDPWYDAENTYQVGDILTVTVARYAVTKEGKHYGVFVDVVPGVTALVHISHISNKRIQSAEECLAIGQVVEAQVLAVNAEEKKLSLGIKEVKAYDPPAKEGEAEDEDAPKEKKERAPRRERTAEKDGEKADRKPRAPKKAKEEEFHDDVTPSGTSIGDLIGGLNFDEESDS
ncbi:MAG: 4-hydroxy-3-methylbut-2-enyl diphosphate reductase [Clostridia bacterium]|nr:4-hydroxy-3-methylbut-2-enyl diphosphate reductase [Clostridia bacterium]